MKQLIATLLILTSASLAQAIHFNQNAPSIICHDELMRIPERGFQVEVFEKTLSREHITMRLQIVDLNQGTEVLFEGPVSEHLNNTVNAFSAEGVNLSIVADLQGNIRGQFSLQQDNEVLQVPVSCKKMYQIMNPQPLL